MFNFIAVAVYIIASSLLTVCFGNVVNNTLYYTLEL